MTARRSSGELYGWLTVAALLAAAAALLVRRRGPTTLGDPGPRVLLLGDSLAQGLTGPLGRWAAATGRQFAALAERGTTIPHWSPGLVSPTLASLRPTTVLVSLGTNDAASMVTPDDLRRQAAELRGRLEASGARVVWLLPPRLPPRCRSELLAALRETVGDRAFDAASLELEQPDGIHPTPAGFEAWAAALTGELR